MANQENSADDVKAKMAAALERFAAANVVVVHLRCNAKQDHLVLALLVK
jgi:hypothetical protein